MDSSFEAFKKVHILAKAAILKSDEVNYVLDSQVSIKNLLLKGDLIVVSSNL